MVTISITSDTPDLGTGAKPFAAPGTARRDLLWQISASPPTPHISGPAQSRSPRPVLPGGRFCGKYQHHLRHLRSHLTSSGLVTFRRQTANSTLDLEKISITSGAADLHPRHRELAATKSSGAATPTGDTPFHLAAPGGGSTMQDPSPAAPTRRSTRRHREVAAPCRTQVQRRRHSNRRLLPCAASLPRRGGLHGHPSAAQVQVQSNW